MAEQPAAESHPTPTPDSPEAAGTPSPSAAAQALGSATYEILRQRLQTEAEVLRERLSRLDARRREVFGSIEFKILKADRIVTAHNCIPRDMVQLGRGRFLFGFNVRFGLKQEVGLGHYEGRGWRGFHHHATLCIAAYGFLISERETIPPSSSACATLFPEFAVPNGYRPRGAALAA